MTNSTIHYPLVYIPKNYVYFYNTIVLNFTMLLITLRSTRTSSQANLLANHITCVVFCSLIILSHLSYLYWRYLCNSPGFQAGYGLLVSEIFDVIGLVVIQFRTELLILWYSFVRTTEPKPKKRILTKEKSIFGRSGSVVLTTHPNFIFV